MSESQNTSNLLGSGLLCAGLALVFLGERVFGQDIGRQLATGAGVLCLLIATGMRVLAFARATADVRGVEGRSLSAYAATWVALGLYALTSESVLNMLSFEDDAAQSKFVSVAYALWMSVLSVALLGLLFMELVYARMPIVASVELRRVRTAAYAGLTLAFSLIFLLSINYVATARDVRRDLSYFRTTQPSQTTLRMLDKLEAPVRAILFWRRNDDVLQQTEPYFATLAQHSKNFSYEILDSAFVPELSRKHRVRGNGYVLLLQGEGEKEKGQNFSVGDELTEARPQLRKLDSLFQEAFAKLARPERKVALTVGHGEFNAVSEQDDSGNPNPGDGLRVVDKVWRRLNIDTTKLGVSEGLSGTVPDDVGAVIAFGPKQTFLPEEVNTLLAYVRGGGRLMLMIDGNTDDGLDPLLAGIGLSRRPGVLASEKNHVSRKHDDSDKTLVFSNRYSSHPSVTTASRFSREIASVFVGGVGLARAPTQKLNPAPKVSFPLRSGPGFFRDIDGDFKRDEDEPEESAEMMAAVTLPAKEGESEGRVVVIGDGDFMTDKVSTNNGNVMVFIDALAWLIGNEELGSEVSSEEDVPIEHSRDQDKIWFYATTFAAPVPLLFLSAWVARRRRRPSESAS